MSIEIKVRRSDTLKSKPDLAELDFGSHTTDHIFIAEYHKQSGWKNARVEPYCKISLDPTALVFHYAQAIFEGIKLYIQTDGKLAAFRPEENARRMNESARKMAMPDIPADLFLQGLNQLALIDSHWLPDKPGFTLYVRPVMIATQAILGVQASEEYLFYMVLTPVKPYYKPGQKGMNLLAINDKSRSSPGDVSDAKTAGNYGKTIRVLRDVKEAGFDNMLWLGGEGNRWVEEAGITNVFVRFEDHIATPPLNGRILAGITRDTVIQLLRQRGDTVVEKEIDINKLCSAIDNGEVIEAFVTGTATTVAPIDSITFNDRKYKLASIKNSLANLLYFRIQDIQNGTSSDKNSWMMVIQ